MAEKTKVKIDEGRVRRGGLRPGPVTEKPDIKPMGQGVQSRKKP